MEHTYSDYEKELKRLESGLAEHKKNLENAYCDKKNLGFNLDDRFMAHTPVKIHLDSWAGYYGNSGCSIVVSDLGELFTAELISYLNNNKHAILQDIITRLKEKADTLKADEIKKLQDRIREIESND